MKTKLRTLVVDDDTTARTVAAAMLDVLELSETTEVDSAVAGLRYLETGLHNLVISDFDMPEMSGLEFLQAVRSHDDPAVRHIPFIIATGDDDQGRRELVLRAGADGYLVKPFGKDQLCNVIEMILRRQNV